MQSPNKIKDKQEGIQSQNHSFQLFLQTLRQQRPHRTMRHPPSEQNTSEISHPPLSETQQISSPKQDIYSEGSRSLYLHSMRATERQIQIGGGDAALKNRGKVGAACRSSLKQYQFPSHYFTPTQQQLQQYLRQSREQPHHIQGSINSNFFQNPSVLKKQMVKESEAALLSESKVLRRETVTKQLSQLNPDIALKYCLIHSLSPNSSVQEILLFFMRLLEVLGFTISQPTIEKYRDCIYFGNGLKQRKIGQGLLFFFSGSLYYGELLSNRMHGRGVQLFFSPPAYFRGDFQDGRMHGYFHVSKQTQQYHGIVQDALYHGHGKLMTNNRTFEGQFHKGQLMTTNYRLSQTPRKSHQEIRKNGSKVELEQERQINKVGFKIVKRSGSYQPSQYQIRNWADQDSKKYSNSRQQNEELDIDPWSQPQSGQNNVKKVKEKVNVNDMMEFSYPFGNELIQFANQNRPKIKSKSFNNPQNNKMNDFSYQRSRDIRQFTRGHPRLQRSDSRYGQQAPLQLKC